MSESSNQHADVSWPHPGSEVARLGGHYAPTGGAADDRSAHEHDIHPAGDRSVRAARRAVRG
ncbi:MULTISPECIES: hypothetical protein [Pseudonocardia]|uniref:Uncharacterized protein n=2 Tax=Pseudonocardia TaxID=1847 RepID=A0A1Y2MUP3_PSEAH|nr:MULTISPECIES: hypothetical protein [Pseudonocardia]OSY38885.1 hypothetical protein BG845_03757 [Pseudonocardia autotrophica]TDN76141.1 hypothetical protein C8E95_5334 [Pseudonocardia autotrophica]BBG00122.1 hypothetical protein Pdca_13310 [Pseudonocardia autotrophica]GEC26087.1 hypothetical protein PSA01_31160 [Pseudonocardia saturnea]